MNPLIVLVSTSNSTCSSEAAQFANDVFEPSNNHDVDALIIAEGLFCIQILTLQQIEYRMVKMSNHYQHLSYKNSKEIINLISINYVKEQSEDSRHIYGSWILLYIPTVTSSLFIPPIVSAYLEHWSNE
jgi:hypothetical protein